MGKNTMVVYADAKGDKVKVTVNGVDKDGNRRTAFGWGSLMGKPTR
jgi:hypothetical protein